ncbi:adenosine kinase [Lentisphaerota bacterium ZTH]|nr:adenosine kinase [Lentisphaerota bacterium]WET05789.1 adenosine kinase [Lentisphaerota bacterium ZTH]
MALNKKIMGAGSPIVDLLVNIDDRFLDKIQAEKGGMVLVDSSGMDQLLAQVPESPSMAPGGSAGNTIFGIAKLGMEASFLGKLSDDENGRFYSGKLVELGGSDKAFHILPHAATGRCLSMVTPDSERTMRTDLGAAATLCVEDITDADFKSVDHVHIEGYLLYLEGVTEKILATAKKHGCTVSLDLATFELIRLKGDVLPQLLKDYVDIVFANEDEAAEFVGEKSPEEQADALYELCPVAAVKLGDKGCCLRDKTGTYRVAANVVKPVDTTAAGDLWAAGFLYGWLNNCPLETCGRFGSITAAEVVQVMGSQISDANWQRIKQELTV